MSTAIFLLGGPGSGKDYVLKNIFSKFDLTEVQIDQVLSGKASDLLEQHKNVVINGVMDAEKIQIVKSILEGYTFDHVFVSVTNKVSRLRNEGREFPIKENSRIDKFLKAQKLAEQFENTFVFNNSINLKESTEMERVLFASQIEKLLERLVGLGLTLSEISHHKSGLPSKYVKGLTPSEIAAKKKHIEKNKDLSDKDPEAYKDMPGDKRIREKGIPQSKYTKKYHAMYGEALEEGAADTSLAAKAKKSGISLSTLKAVYRRGVAAWNSGHRPGTTPAQWGHARVNSYITKGKTYHTADKDLREETDIDKLVEMQLVGTDEYRKHAIAMTPGQKEIEDVSKTARSPQESIGRDEECECGGCEDCAEQSAANVDATRSRKSFRSFRESVNGGSTVDLTPTLSKDPKKNKKSKVPGQYLDATMHGIPVVTTGAGMGRFGEEVSLKEAVQYHIDNKISFTENVFRPGSDKFFELIGEAKRLYREGKYTPADEYEQDLLNSDIGEKAIYEGEEVILDFPFELVNEEGDPTNGHGIGKPFRKGGGGAVYVKSGDSVRLVNFSQSGMKKRFNEPGRVRSFVARHHCLTNKDKTSASYWACRWPRYFSNSGQQWW